MERDHLSPPLDWTHGEYRVTTDPHKIEVAVVHDYLANASYWAAGIPREVVEKSIRHSLNFGLFHRHEGHSPQVGFARVVTDYASFAYLADVFVLPEHRGRGLSKWLMECVVAHPDLQGLRRWCLLTADAHGLYARYGFTPVAKPERYMERHDPEIYKRRSTSSSP